MISQEIRSNSLALKGILPQIAPEQAEVVRLIRRNLDAVADYAEELEHSEVLPAAPAVVGEEGGR